MPLSNKAQYISQISAAPATAHGIFMKGTWQPVFSAVFMVNTPKCSRARHLFHGAAILDRCRGVVAIPPLCASTVVNFDKSKASDA